MARAALRTTGVNDFTGGLNLGPPQELASNEVAMARDVFFSARGGFNTRPGQVPFCSETVDATGNEGASVLRHVHRRASDGVAQLFVIRESDNELFWTSGGVLHDTGITVGSIQGIVIDDEGGGGYPIGINGAQYLDKSYFVQAFDQFGQEWDGFQMTPLGLAFDPDIAAPVPGNMPDAAVIAVKGEFAFVGDVREWDGDDAGTRQAGRVRWSHPGGPTSWREEDFVDLPEGRVTALVPFRDYLAVFTDDAVYGIYGDSSETFQLQQITSTSGTPFHGSVTTSPGFLYWWDWDQGIMRMGSGAPVSVFDKIKPFFDAGGFDSLDPDAQFPPFVFWGQGKLYVQSGFYWRNIRFADELGTTLVYDPAIGRDGAWTSITTGTTNKRNGTVYPRTFGGDLVVVGGKYVPLIVNDPTYALDRNHLYDANDKQVPSALVRTAPFEGDTNATKKRWRRPRVAIRSKSGKQEIRFGYLRNYYEGTPSSFNDIELDFSAFLNENSAFWDGGASWSDAFATENTFRWSGYADSAISAAGNLQIALTNVDGNEILRSTHSYNIHNVEVSINAVTPPTNSSMSFLMYKGNANVRFTVTTTTVFMSWRDTAGTTTNLTSTPYGASSDWLRFVIDDINITWFTSADGISWTQRNQIPVPADFITNNVLDEATIELRGEQTSSGSTTAIFDTFTFTDTNDTVDGFGTWDSSMWAADMSSNDPPDNWIAFETLPSGGAGNVFQMEWRSISGGLLSADATNSPWGLDSIVLPYREKGVR